ncbi:MAG TPA: hypothetical protein VG168_02085 [Bryobacteraceae bacterium]|nr:hypothetical protein [Bryobacteraceae bacterium]
MGTWTLDRLTTHSTPLDGPVFGTNFHAVFHLRYVSATFGSFQETPNLDWHETIMMNEHHNNQSWVFATNMYTHNPTSVTLIVWARRYLEAYRAVAGQPKSVQKGKVEFKKLNGTPVTLADLGGAKNTPNEQATAIRSYLKSHGGQMIIEIHDVPGINTPTGVQHKERLLHFDVGVVGGPLRARAEQYLNVQAGAPPAGWQREFSNTGWNRAALPPPALPNAAPPAMVSNPRAPIFTAGECW